jgi:LmbE family N-acetylglucosaminyl deacetylase
MSNSLDKNNSNKSQILVVVAHSDDETIGVGGTIARHVMNGDHVYVLSLTDGVGARRNINLSGDIKKRLSASRNAAKILGFKWLDGEKFPDNEMDSVPLLSIVKRIEEIKNIVKPNIIYTHTSADLNVDHRLTCQATLTAFRPQPDEPCVEFRMFEVASATDYGYHNITNNFYPNLYVNIEETWKKKLSALKEYSSELRDAPHSRSLQGIEILSNYRGIQVGLYKAEAFEVVRRIIR